MIITESKGYKTTDNDGNNPVFHATRDAAQQHAIEEYMVRFSVEKGVAIHIAAMIIKHKSELLTILTGQRGKDKVPRKRKATQEVQP